MIRRIQILVVLVLLITSTSCISYSFTGAPITAKSISINFFPNKARLVNPSLSQTLTDGLRDKFVNQTKLDLVEGDADLHLEGEILDYGTRPVAIQGNEKAALNRLTIVVQVRFTNTEPGKENDSFDQRFTGYEDYDAARSFTSVEDELVSIITNRIVTDVFNKAVVNW
ncbi:MAG: hypothetical protein DRI84_06995 [Bacteroidetes bacterium]|nr:MAG: hypothetical protein DRI84_06995 [Bacteroidota bacterium]